MKESILARPAQVHSGSPVAAYFEMTKPRITLLVVLTAVVGYIMGSGATVSWIGLLNIVVGTALVAAGAGVLNQVAERDADGRMLRTARRAIPSGRVSPEHGLVFGMILGLGGLVYVTIFLNVTAAAIAAVTLASYVLVYTPLKRKTSLNTLVGAIPGALPPVGGWAAATGAVPREAWGLFLLVYLWQVPHFLAVAWLLRDDYLRGGFRMLTVGDSAESLTGRHIALSALALIPVSLAPSILGLSGTVYFAGALVLSGAYAGVSLWAAWKLTAVRARRLFLTSVIYLPAILAVMLLDRLPG